jgi:putative peptide zinc metalloprotease protein
VMLGRFVAQLARSVWRRTSGRPVRRGVSLVAAGALAAGLAWAWWPDGRTYRPIDPDERGSLMDGMATTDLARPAPASAGTALEAGSEGVVSAVWDSSQPLPTESRPQLALVLVPEGNSGGEAGWIFPFSKPLAPGPGDNQALAVNTEDGTVEYDVAISLVWVTDDEPVLNTNEAYAFASCTNCASVAVAFQVVVVVGDNPAVVPQNLAGALNSDCVNCLTYALAQQLLVTIAEPLSDEAMAALDSLWAELAEFAENIEAQPLDAIDDQLDQFAAEILTIIEADQPGTLPTDTPSPTGSSTPADPSAIPSPTADPSPTDTGSATPAPSTTDSAEAPTESPTASPTPSDSTSP